MKRSEALTKVKEIKKLFVASKLIDSEVSISFDKHNDVTVVEDVYLDKVTGFKLPLPERIEGGKKYTPSIFTIKCLTHKLTFILEDVQVFAISAGLRVIIGDRRIDLRKV